eukprot:366511-Chlamydomonas_euryale.AAC.9
MLTCTLLLHRVSSTTVDKLSLSMTGGGGGAGGRRTRACGVAHVARRPGQQPGTCVPSTPVSPRQMTLV